MVAVLKKEKKRVVEFAWTQPPDSLVPLLGFSDFTKTFCRILPSRMFFHSIGRDDGSLFRSPKAKRIQDRKRQNCFVPQCFSVGEFQGGRRGGACPYC